MDYIYSVDLKSYLSSNEIKTSDLCSCALSSRNLLAFANDCCVYILPLEKPNELIPVNLNNSPCVYLAWSDDGLFLLSICKNGVCNLYNIKTNLLNTIDPVFSFRINKDELILTKAFSKLSKLCLDHDKLDSLNYFEKFQHSTFSCMKDLSGLLLLNGFLILTNRGKLHFCFTDFNSVKKKYEFTYFDMKLEPPQNSVKDENSMECGGDQVENKEEIFYELGDISYEADGSINVAYTNNDQNSPIYIYKVMIKFNNVNNALEGTSELISTLNLNLTEQGVSKNKIFFVNNEMASNLCVQLSYNQLKTQTLQFWQANKESYDSAITPTTSWNLVNKIASKNQIISLKIPKNELSFKNYKNLDNQDYKFYMTAAYKDGQIGFINTLDFTQTYISQIPNKMNDPLRNSQNEVKKFKSSTKEHVVAIEQSITGLIGVGITNQCNLITFRQPNFKELQSMNSNNPISIHQLTNHYEHAVLTGNDFWDLIISTNPRFFDSLIENLEINFQNQSNSSIKKAYFTRFYSLICALSRRSISATKEHSKSIDILAKLILNRSVSIMNHTIQISLNIESLVTLFANSNPSLINSTNQSVPLINTNLVTNNFEYINSQILPNTQANNFNHILIKNNLNEYFDEILKMDSVTNTNLNELKLNEIVQSILNRKNTSIVVNYQLKHIAQWIIDMSLSLINVTLHKTGNSNSENDFFGASLLRDQIFLNEMRKGLLFVKLLFLLNQTNYQLPVLPYRSMGHQKDLLADLFSVITSLIHKINDNLAPVDENLIEQCTLIQSDTIQTSLDKKFFNLRQSWFGLSTSSWLKTFQFPVDYLFDEERPRKQYPLFDIVKLINFSRSSLTKQCVRCGNYTETSTESCGQEQKTSQNNLNRSQNCILMQDLCGDKCICGGSWIFSPIQ